MNSSRLPLSPPSSYSSHHPTAFSLLPSDTALFSACLAGNVSAVSDLLLRLRLDASATRGKEKWTPLHVAANLGHAEVVEVLVKKGKADVNKQNTAGCSPLYVACARGHLAAAKRLVEQRAYLNLASNYGFTPLYIATLNGHKGVKKYLEEKMETADVVNQPVRGANAGANAARPKSRMNVNTPLFAASKHGHLDIVKCLVEKGGADANKANSDGTTALVAAALGGHQKVVTYLVEEAGADVNIKSVGGETAAMAAKAGGHADVAAYLEARAEGK